MIATIVFDERSSLSGGQSCVGLVAKNENDSRDVVSDVPHKPDAVFETGTLEAALQRYDWFLQCRFRKLPNHLE